MQRQVRVRKATFDEILLWYDKKEIKACNDAHDGDPLLLMIDLFQKINRVIRTENDLNLSGEEINFKELVHLQLLDHEE